MTTDLIKQVHETFGDLKGLNLVKVKALIEDTVRELHLLQEKMASKDPKERDAAFEAAQALKQALEEQTKALSQSLQLNPEQLASFAENRDHFNEGELQMLDEMKESLNGLSKRPAATVANKARASRKTWIAG